jgi:hypothetical protein
MRRLFLLSLLFSSIFFSSQALTITPDIPASKHPRYHEYLPLNYSVTTEKCPYLILHQESGEIGSSREPDIWKVANHGSLTEIPGNKYDMRFADNKHEYFNVIGTQTGSGAGFSVAEFQNIYNHNPHSYRFDSIRIYVQWAFKWAVNNINSPNIMSALGEKSGTMDCKTVKVVRSGNMPFWSRHGKKGI